MDLEKAKHKFQNYVGTFNTKDKNVHQKLEHSYEVMELSKELATRLSLKQEEIELATLIGLLHDIGRFYQISKTNGMNDAKLDHSNYGIIYLFEQNHIRDFIEDRKHDEIIKKAVLYHNDMCLPQNLTETEKLFCKIIRDADKIDIYRVYAEKYHHKWTYSDITPAVLSAFKERVLINLRDKKTNSDTVMIVLAFLFDINFEESFDLLKKKGYFIRYIDHVTVDKKSKENWKQLTEQCKLIIERRDKYVR